jgi:DNA invertase Pin-like site-specific DNA recombinase
LIGTQRENVQDSYNRHRRVHPWKISRDVLAQIYTLKEQGLMNKDIAARLNISRQVVSKYLRFKKEVPQDWRCLLDQLLCLEK